MRAPTSDATTAYSAVSSATTSAAEPKAATGYELLSLVLEAFWNFDGHLVTSESRSATKVPP